MKGMQKIKRGSGFGGAISYAINREEGDEPGQIIGGNMSGTSVKVLTAEFGASRKLRPDIKKPVWHNSLRLPQGEHLEPEKLAEIADDYMTRMGFTDLHQRVYVMHDDPEGQHVHIVASRVSLEGAVYLGRNENLESTRHIQALEKVHGLTITKGPRFENGKVKMPEDKKPKKGEIEMAAASGKRPARLELAVKIKEALVTPCTAVEFCERLQSAGVTVRPSIKKGTMNGFSFKLPDSVGFKGSQIGDGYKWEQLQKKGVEYVEVRDSEKLADFQRLAADIWDHGEPTGSDSQGSSPIDTIGAESRGDSRGTEDGTRGTGGGDLRPDETRTEGSIRPNQQVSPSHSTATSPLESLEGSGEREPESSGQERTGTRRSDTENGRPDQPDTTKLVVENPRPVTSRDNKRNSRGDWATGFRKVSAGKRRAGQQAGRGELPASISKSDKGAMGSNRRDHKTIDPTPYLESQGFTVKKSGRHHSVKLNGDEIYRLTEKPDGSWIWCDNYGNRGGDNLDLVKELEPQKSFTNRVYALTDEARPTDSNRPRPKPTPARKPKMPYRDQKAVEQGREYLLERKISQKTIEAAEQQQFLDYCSDGIFFCGYDENGELAAVTKRATDAAAEVQKKDLYGTDKSCPPILQGGWTVWIVEGGADALALHDLKRRAGEPLPTVIVSGGARVYSFLERPKIQEILKGARSVTVAYEKEDSPEKQEQTDAGHDRQRDIAAEITGRNNVMEFKTGVKDLAALNKMEVTTIEAEAEAERDRQRRTPDHDDYYGMER